MESFNLNTLNQIANAIAAEGALAVSAPLFLLLVVFWVIPWKGYALWTAATRKEKWWFVALLIVNTLSILEIFYLLKVAKKKDEIVLFFKKKVLRRE